jgi:uncharacterized protein HemY
VAAGLALDRGEFDQARRLLARAEELSPGGPDIAVAAAEVALRCDTLDTARRAIAAAVKSIRANPLSILDGEIARLEALLADRLPAADRHPIAIENIFID